MKKQRFSNCEECKEKIQGKVKLIGTKKVCSRCFYIKKIENRQKRK